MKKKLSLLEETDVREFVDPSTWVIPYGSLMTILMILYTILYGYAHFGSTQYEKTISSLQKNAGGEQKNLETDLAKKIETYLDEKGLDKYAKVEINAQKVKIMFTNPVLFDLGSAELKPAAIPTLNEIVKYLQGMDNPIIVEGYTDNLPIYAGEYHSNWELSAARAFSVIHYFIENGIKPEKLSALGYGEFRPLAPNDSEENRAKNRRIEIIILRTQTKSQ